MAEKSKSQLKRTFSNLKDRKITDTMMSDLIDSLWQILPVRSNGDAVELYVNGEWVEINSDNVSGIVARALPQEITYALNVDKYMAPLALKAIRVTCRNDEFGDDVEYLFPTGVIYERILEDLIIEP